MHSLRNWIVGFLVYWKSSLVEYTLAVFGMHASHLTAIRIINDAENLIHGVSIEVRHIGPGALSQFVIIYASIRVAFRLHTDSQIASSHHWPFLHSPAASTESRLVSTEKPQLPDLDRPRHGVSFWLRRTLEPRIWINFCRSLHSNRS